MADFHLTTRADLDLEDIYIYTVLQFGEAQAERYTRDLYGRLDLLSDFPGIGRPAKLADETCLKFPSGSHVIYYRRMGADILIGRILHASQEPSLHRFS